MSKLVDSTPPVPYSEIENVIKQEIGLGKFKSIDKNSIGSASIAQVHKGILKVRKVE